MDYFLVILLSIIIIALIATLVIKSRKKVDSKSKDGLDRVNSDPITSEALEMGVKESVINIPIERLMTTEIDEKGLFEITDSTVIARISETIPAAAEIAAKTIMNRALKNVELYKAIIPSGATLAESKQINGAVRGFYRGAKKIKGQANFVKVGPTKISKVTSVANGFANVINVGSLVVGQYYMSEITSKLETMTKNIDKIGDFQDREFMSRILSVITRVGEISQFSSEIMESDDQRKLKLAALDNLKATNTELLGQVNITISDITQKTPRPDYKDYQSKISDFHKLVGYQNTLVAILEEISKLTYLLGKGTISTEQSYSSFKKYLELSIQTRTLLGQWHDKQVKALRIDLDKERISKAGLKAVVSAIPGLFDDKFKYSGLSPNLVTEISNQAKINSESPSELKQVYDDDVEIIIKDGKYYYTQEASSNSQETFN